MISGRCDLPHGAAGLLRRVLDADQFRVAAQRAPDDAEPAALAKRLGLRLGEVGGGVYVAKHAGARHWVVRHQFRVGGDEGPRAGVGGETQELGAAGGGQRSRGECAAPRLGDVFGTQNAAVPAVVRITAVRVNVPTHRRA